MIRYPQSSDIVKRYYIYICDNDNDDDDDNDFFFIAKDASQIVALK